MKKFIIFAILLLTTNSIFAERIENTENTVNAARVVELIKLVNKPDIQVNFLVEDIGGTTDVSPTQILYFNIYAKGEMFSTDASFFLGPIYSFKSAKRVSGGIYEITVSLPNSETSMPETKTLIVDAQEAIISIKNVKCDDFDCDSSTNFEASIELTVKK